LLVINFEFKIILQSLIQFEYVCIISNILLFGFFLFNFPINTSFELYKKLNRDLINSFDIIIFSQISFIEITKDY